MSTAKKKKFIYSAPRVVVGKKFKTLFLSNKQSLGIDSETLLSVIPK